MSWVVFGCNYPPVDEDVIETRVAERLGRQKILERKPRPVLHYILEENILRTQLGVTEVMRDQLLHLRRCVDLPFVTLQIMPRAAPGHAGLGGRPLLLETSDHGQLAYVSGHLHASVFDESADVSALMQRYGMLRSQALTVQGSTRLLDALLEKATQHTRPLVLPPSTGSSRATAATRAETA
ncbi:DUF5753 domain-containing protein [Streptomyces rubiginosohelvolus]|uniref:DUF5753 domain-containing protein n=1 Tax=Streptomyces rubiginosohelvolus TaxID=67362 RepID=UPI00367CAC9D